MQILTKLFGNPTFIHSLVPQLRVSLAFGRTWVQRLVIDVLILLPVIVVIRHRPSVIRQIGIDHSDGSVRDNVFSYVSRQGVPTWTRPGHRILIGTLIVVRHVGSFVGFETLILT